MNCFAEATYAMFADGELSPPKVVKVQAHLATCLRCRELVAALKAENRVLSSAFSIAVEEKTTLDDGAVATKFFREFLAVTAVLAVVGAALHWLNAQDLPAGLTWLNPFTSAGRTNLFFNFLFYVQTGGADMLQQVASVIGRLVVLVMVGGGALLLTRGLRTSRSSLFVAAVILATVLPGRAVEKRRGQPALTIEQNETIDDTLVATGETVAIDGTVNGDLMTSGRTVIIRGTVKGNVFAWGQNVEITGTVEGSVFSSSQILTVRGQVSHSIYSWAQFLRLEPLSHVGAVVIGSQQVDLHGKVDKSVVAFAGAANVRGEIGRDLLFRGSTVELASPTHIGGNFLAYVRDARNIHIASGVTIAGKNETHLRGASNRFGRPGFYFLQVVSLIAAFLVGSVAILLVPKFFQSTSQAVGSVWRSLGLGFAILVGTPVAVLLVCVTLIGLPLGLLTLALYVIGLYLAKIFVGAFLGHMVLKVNIPSTRRSILALLIGLLILTLLFQIPVIGALLHLVVFCFGLGAFTWQIYGDWRAQRVQPYAGTP